MTTRRVRTIVGDEARLLSPEEREAIAARLEAATYGPWVVKRSERQWNDLGREKFPDKAHEPFPQPIVEILTGWKHGQVNAPIPIIWLARSPYTEPSHFLHFDQGDAEFIAAARSDIPKLLAHIRVLEAELAELRRAKGV